MWLYVYSGTSEYSYMIQDDVQRMFLKDITLYYDGVIKEKNGFKILKVQDRSVLYKSGKYKHKQLLPSYWGLCFFLCVLGGLVYLIAEKL